MFADKHVCGLSHFTELHSEYEIWCICDLCGAKLLIKHAQSHRQGVKHRLLYMRQHHPDLYEKLKSLHDKGIPFYKELDKYAKEKEESDEPGKPSIKIFVKKEGGAEESTSEDKDKTAKDVHAYIQWVNSERDVALTSYKDQFRDRSVSPILNIKRIDKKSDDKEMENQSRGARSVSHDHIPSLLSDFVDPHTSQRRQPLPKGKHSLFQNPVPFDNGPLHPHDLPPPHHAAYLERDLLARERFLDRDPLLRDRFLGRDPLLRERFRDMDPLLRDQYLKRDSLSRDPYFEMDPYLERDPLLRERYLDRDPLFRKRYADMDRRPPFRDRDSDIDRGPPIRHPDMGRGPPIRARDAGPYPDADPRFMDRPPKGDSSRGSWPDPFMSSESNKSRSGADEPYLNPDPLKRIRKPSSQSDSHSRTKPSTSEPYIDPDPLKRVLPSQKAKAKPVVIDYGHGKEEKSEKSKAKEWEDDINDILNSGKKSKEPDSLALLSSSYSSPKRGKSPKKKRSPPRAKPTKPLPFERSYLDRVKDFDLLSKKAESDSSYSKRKRSQSPEYPARNPDYPAQKHNRNQWENPPYKSSYLRDNPSHRSSYMKDSLPFKSSRMRDSPFGKGKQNLDTISISSESPPWVDSPDQSRKSPKKVRRYVKSPKFKKVVNSKKYSDSSSSSRSRSRSKSRSRSRSSSNSRSRSRSRFRSRCSSSSSTPPRSSKYLRPKSPTMSALKSKPFLSSSKLPSPSLYTLKSSFKSSMRSKSPSPTKYIPTGPTSRSKGSLSQTDSLPKSPPRAPLPTSPPASTPFKATKSLSESLPASLPFLPPSNPPQKLSRSNSPSGTQPPESPPPELAVRSRSSPGIEPMVSAVIDEEDEDAQAERIANMLLSMKSSIVGSEMDDPHAALQALLSSQELTEALLATRAEASKASEWDRKGASKSGVEQSSELEVETTFQKKTSPKTASGREKIAFAFAGKSSVPTRNVPQTFLEEDSSEDENK